MNREYDMPIKIRHISIRNYKGIDELDMAFPLPRLSDDPDIFVIGSENGLGKTSIIECCAFLMLGPMMENRRFSSEWEYPTIDVPDFLIRAGEDAAEISGEIIFENKSATVKIRIDERKGIEFSGKNLKLFTKMAEDMVVDSNFRANDLIRAICGFTPNPVIKHTFMLFHSYRKVREENPEMGMMMLNDGGSRRRSSMVLRDESSMHTFKLEILRSLMIQADLFGHDKKEEAVETIKVLNELMKSYAKGIISELIPSSDNTVSFKVDPLRNGKSFTFDGLSSGQKEIISTLFLIWYHTRNRPSVVFIDEPELHLNAQWHRKFVKSLIDLAPQNQYIIATHSEDVMDSVRADRRALLSSDQEGEE